MRNRWKFSSIWGLLSALLITGVLALTFWGNSANLNPRFLFIDEQITFYPIIKLLNPSGLDEFLWLSSDGSDYRYGRILWNSIALIALIPAKLFGEAGQIIASREAGVIFLLASYLLLIHTFIQKLVIRFVALITLISLPYNSYYMSMPKPEPIMLLCAALFLFFYKKNNLALGKPYWILIGMAFGAKISFIIPLLILFCTAVTFHRSKGSGLRLFKKSFLSSCYITLGFVIANPYFFPSLIFIIYALLVLLLFSRLLGLPYGPLLTIFCIIGALSTVNSYVRHEVFTPVLELTNISHALQEWISGTFLKVNEGALVHKYSLIEWITYLFNVIVKGHPIIGCLYVISVGAALLSQAITLLSARNSLNPTSLLILILSAIGLSLLFLPMIGAKNRLWGMYLFPGQVFTILSLYSYIDLLVAPKPPIASQTIKAFVYPAVALTIIMMLIVWVPNWMVDFITLSLRDTIESMGALPPHLIGI